MKAIFSLIFLGFFATGAARADQLLCASQKDQVLYYSTGQVRLTAEIANTSLLANISLSTTGNKDLGSHEAEVSGKIQGDYVRFEIGGDAWCGYKLTLPKGFMTRERTPAFVDAYCEENSKYSIRLNCSVQ